MMTKFEGLLYIIIRHWRGGGQMNFLKTSLLTLKRVISEFVSFVMYPPRLQVAGFLGVMVGPVAPAFLKK